MNFAPYCSTSYYTASHLFILFPIVSHRCTSVHIFSHRSVSFYIVLNRFTSLHILLQRSTFSVLLHNISYRFTPLLIFWHRIILFHIVSHRFTSIHIVCCCLSAFSAHQYIRKDNSSPSPSSLQSLPSALHSSASQRNQAGILPSDRLGAAKEKAPLKAGYGQTRSSLPASSNSP